MKKDTKLYKVELGLMPPDGDDVLNWRNSNVIARDAPEAIKKVRLRKNEYVAGVVFLYTVNA